MTSTLTAETTTTAGHQNRSAAPDRGRPRRVRVPRLALALVSLTAAAAAVTAVLVVGDPAPQQAYASWTPVPQTAARPERVKRL